jgi:choline dehydrogenase
MSQSTRAFLSRLPGNWPNVEYVLSGTQEVLLAASSPANSAGVGMLLTSTTSAGNITLRSADNVVSPRV